MAIRKKLFKTDLRKTVGTKLGGDEPGIEQAAALNTILIFR
jgi:hypothetical protein